jgi:hypothetical protein
MEIWDEQVRLQDARERAGRLQKAFEPTHLDKPTAAPPRQRHQRPHVHVVWRVHPLGH